jgi:hypothetical protein
VALVRTTGDAAGGRAAARRAAFDSFLFEDDDDDGDDDDDDEDDEEDDVDAGINMSASTPPPRFSARFRTIDALSSDTQVASRCENDEITSEWKCVNDCK